MSKLKTIEVLDNSLSTLFDYTMNASEFTKHEWIEHAKIVLATDLSTIVRDIIGEEPREDETSPSGICFSERQTGKYMLYRSQRQKAKEHGLDL